MYNPNPYSYRNDYHIQPTIDQIGVDKVNKIVEEYLAEDESKCVIKLAINRGEASKLLELYKQYDVFREHLVFAIYKRSLQALVVINNLVTKKYGYDRYMLDKCIEYNYLMGFRYLVSNGYRIWSFTIDKCIEYLRYDFLDYMFLTFPELIIDAGAEGGGVFHISKIELFEKAKYTGSKEMLLKVKDYGAKVDERNLLGYCDISGLELAREIYDYKYTSITLRYALDTIYTDKLLTLLAFLKKTDIENLIDWKSHGKQLFAIGYRTPELIELFKNSYGAIPCDKTIFTTGSIELLETVKKLYNYKCPRDIEKYIVSSNNKEFLKYISDTCTDKNVVWDTKLLERAVVKNNYALVEFLLDLKVDYNIYNLDLNGKTDIALLLLEKIKPEESPLLNSKGGTPLKCSIRQVVDNIDLDLPEFRPLIYLDNTNMHTILNKKCKRKRDYLVYRDKQLVSILENFVSKDVAQYIICKYI